ncbi:MAG TPA: cytochrome c [Methylophilaceae bacterium]|nr:cytochrome c [Methylophilaceae bacterium]
MTTSAFAAGHTPQVNYILRCAGCHGLDGTGSSIGGVPPLGLIKTFTSDPEGRLYVMHVPGVVNSGLSNQEIADVINYVAQRWGSPDLPFESFGLEEVNHLRSINISDVVSYRRDLTSRYISEGKRVPEYPWP